MMKSGKICLNMMSIKSNLRIGGRIVEKLNYFDCCAAAILIALFISMIVRRMVRGRVNRYFLLMLIVGILSVIFDIVCIELDNGGLGHIGLKYTMHTGYLALHNLSTPLYVVYLITLGDMWHKMRKHYLFFGLLMSPFVFVVIALAINFAFPVVFYLDGNDHYTRGPAFFILYFSAAVYVAYGLYFLLRHRKVFEKKLLMPLLSLFPLQIAAVVAQMFRPQIPIEMFAQSLGMLLIITIIQRPEERIDNVTGLGKYDAYAQDMKRSFINEKKTSLILINIANYHVLYDILGYDGTNQMLRVIADRLGELDHEFGTHADIYYLDEGRYSFVIDPRFCQKATDAAKHVNETLKRGVQINQMDVNLVVYVCVVECPEDIGDFETLNSFGHDFSENTYTGEVAHAGEIMKRDHYDILCQLDAIIERALANHDFSVYYQPIYSVNERRFNSAEALLRLKDKEFGFISPELFIPAAEKSGAIHKIGEYVMEEVCSFISGSEFAGLGLDYIEVNLSVAQCMQHDLADKVIGTIERYHVEPDKLNLEITETAASNSQRMMEENIDRLTRAGFKFSLDDFGTGYSNMRRVASLPLTIVKLDKTFTRTQDNPNMGIVLENTIRMLKDMNMKIVVEGVETQNMVEQFSQLQCEYIQGYYYSKPIPKDDFIGFIRNANG